MRFQTSGENRAAAGVAAGDDVEVDLVLDELPREVALPTDLAAALSEDAAVGDAFASLAFSHRKEWVRWVEEAKRPQTRESRIAKTVEALRAGKRSR